jgi:hypothetical protein
MIVKHWPRGYEEANHETIGASVLAVLHVLKAPEQVLGPETARTLRELDPKGWYPIGLLLGIMEKLERNVGHYGLVNLGRRWFELWRRNREPLTSARDAIHGIDAMYRSANRGGQIGGWAITKLEPGYAEVEKTTPHHCVVEQGLLTAALTDAGCPSIIAQQRCVRQGADSCLYTLASTVDAERWLGKPT